MSTPVVENKSRAELSLLENFKLCGWLNDPANIRPGDTAASLAERAAVALNNPRYNQYHVRSRLEALEIVVPPAVEPVDINKAIALLAEIIATVNNGGRIEMTDKRYQQLTALMLCA